MSRATASIEQQQPAASSNGLLVGVGLGVAFLTFIAFLSVVKQGNLFNESNLLYLALIFYGGASALYIGFGVTGVDRYVKFASIATMIGFATNTLAVGHRWYMAGRPPFANIYEMLLSFVWTLAALTLLAPLPWLPLRIRRRVTGRLQPHSPDCHLHARPAAIE